MEDGELGLWGMGSWGVDAKKFWWEKGSQVRCVPIIQVQIGMCQDISSGH